MYEELHIFPSLSFNLKLKGFCLYFAFDSAADSGRAPRWYEWSVGVAGEPVGTGLLDHFTQHLWIDNTINQSAVFTVEQSKLKGMLVGEFCHLMDIGYKIWGRYSKSQHCSRLAYLP